MGDTGGAKSFDNAQMNLGDDDDDDDDDNDDDDDDDDDDNDDIDDLLSEIAICKVERLNRVWYSVNSMDGWSYETRNTVTDIAFS